MTVRTIGGIRLTRGPTTWWLTDDGRGEVARVRAIEQCESPHPMREPDPYTRRRYCEGGEDHDREIGWGATYDGRDIGDLFQSFAEAADALAKHIRLGVDTP